jgi:membrane associated rhomboid family serine protease
MRDGYQNSPLNPIPPVVWLLVLPVAAMEIVLSAGGTGLAGGQLGIGWRNDALQRFALSPEMLDQMLASGQWPADWLMRFVTYPFVHYSFTNALFGVVFLLALGKFVGEVLSPLAVLAIFVLSGIAAGVVYSLVPGLRMALVGAFPPVYGLIGTFTFILWARLGAANANRARAFQLIGFLLAVQLLFGLIFGSDPTWIADLAGFAAGFGLSFVLGPGGPTQILNRVRRR